MNTATRLKTSLAQRQRQRGAVAIMFGLSLVVLIRAQLHQIANGIPVSNMVIDYVPSGCDASNCKTVTVRLSGATFNPLILLMGGSYPIPEFATSLPHELMNSAGNPVCP
jgi:hypothetical protein